MKAQCDLKKSVFIWNTFRVSYQNVTSFHTVTAAPRRLLPLRCLTWALLDTAKWVAHGQPSQRRTAATWQRRKRGRKPGLEHPEVLCRWRISYYQRVSATNKMSIFPIGDVIWLTLPPRYNAPSEKQTRFHRLLNNSKRLTRMICIAINRCHTFLTFKGSIFKSFTLFFPPKISDFTANFYFLRTLTELIPYQLVHLHLQGWPTQLYFHPNLANLFSYA